MRDRVEVIAEVSVYDFTKPMFGNVVVDPADRGLGIDARPKTVLLIAEIGVENGADHQERCHLNNAVTKTRYAERALPAIALGYPDAKKGLSTIGFVPQLLLQRCQPGFDTLSFDLLERDAVDSRRAPVGTAAAVGFGQHVDPVDLVPQAVETISGVRLGFRL